MSIEYTLHSVSYFCNSDLHFAPLLLPYVELVWTLVSGLWHAMTYVIPKKLKCNVRARGVQNPNTLTK